MPGRSVVTIERWSGPHGHGAGTTDLSASIDLDPCETRPADDEDGDRGRGSSRRPGVLVAPRPRVMVWPDRRWEPGAVAARPRRRHRSPEGSRRHGGSALACGRDRVIDIRETGGSRGPSPGPPCPFPRRRPPAMISANREKGEGAIAVVAAAASLAGDDRRLRMAAGLGEVRHVAGMAGATPLDGAPTTVDRAGPVTGTRVPVMVAHLEALAGGSTWPFAGGGSVVPQGGRFSMVGRTRAFGRGPTWRWRAGQRATGSRPRAGYPGWRPWVLPR